MTEEEIMTLFLTMATTNRVARGVMVETQTTDTPNMIVIKTEITEETNVQTTDTEIEMTGTPDTIVIIRTGITERTKITSDQMTEILDEIAIGIDKVIKIMSASLMYKLFC
jgi:hypothetical protein